MKSTVSALAMAFALAACTTASAGNAPAATAESAAAAPAPVAEKPASAADAAAFVATAEKELSDFSLINNRAQWVNNTHITDDTDALAAYFAPSAPRWASATPKARRRSTGRRASTSTPAASSTS